MSEDLRTTAADHIVDHSCGPQTGVHIRKKPKTRERLLSERPDRNERYSALVWLVLTDRRLKPLDWGVYACIASQAFETDTVQVATRWIAANLGSGSTTIKRGIARLTAAGHIAIIVQRRGNQAPIYRLTSPVFGKRQKIILEAGGKPNLTTRADIETLRERVRLRQSK